MNLTDENIKIYGQLQHGKEIVRSILDLVGKTDEDLLYRDLLDIQQRLLSIVLEVRGDTVSYQSPFTDSQLDNTVLKHHAARVKKRTAIREESDAQMESIFGPEANRGE